MKDYKTRQSRMAPFRKTNLLLDVAVIGFCILAGVVFALVVADLIWGQIAVTEWLASIV